MQVKSEIINLDNDSNTQVATKILGKSLPRSGHHFFIKMLNSCLQEEFDYCEIYKNKNCCKSTPCDLDYSGLLFLQKSHDFRLTDEIIESCKYLIQFRHPIPRLFSHWNLAVKNNKSLLDTQDQFVRFARLKKKYYIDFMRKWFFPFCEDPRFFMMSYESLVGEPFYTTQQFLKFAIDINYELDRKSFNQSQLRVKPTENLKSHKYYEPGFLDDYQLSIINELPQLPYLPMVL